MKLFRFAPRTAVILASASCAPRYRAGHLLFVQRLFVESASIQMPPLRTSDCSALLVGITTVALRAFEAQIADVWWNTALVPSPNVACRSTGAGIAPTLSMVTEYPFPDGATADIARSM